MESTVEQNKSKPLTILVVIVVLVLIIASLISKEMNQVLAFIGNSGWIGLLISIVLYGILGASPIPSEPLTVLNSTIFGPFNATLAAGLGNLLAALVEYYIGKRLNAVGNLSEKMKKLPFGLDRFPVDSPIFLIGARMLPGYGPKFVSLLAGVKHVSIWRYIWTTLVSTLIGAALFAYGGFGLLNLLPFYHH